MQIMKIISWCWQYINSFGSMSPLHNTVFQPNKDRKLPAQNQTADRHN